MMPSVAASEWPMSSGSIMTSSGGRRTRRAWASARRSARPSPVTTMIRSMPSVAETAFRVSASIALTIAARPGRSSVSSSRCFARGKRFTQMTAVAAVVGIAASMPAEAARRPR